MNYDFNFNIILNLPSYAVLYKKAMSLDLIRDICDDKYSELSEEELNLLPEQYYINVVQKSPSWLFLRKKSSGTASAVGKYLYIKTNRFPTKADVRANIIDKLNDAPFVKSKTTAGHMKWGVKYEEAALMHFALVENVGILQVGSIKVSFAKICKLGRICFGDKWNTSVENVNEKYLLVSPDGIVGKPEEITKNECYSELYGMLEIKCISPFHHLETDDGFLKWTPNMNTRQWHTAKEIPFVYIVQQCLQAISGIIKYGMTVKHFMWFIRWSPIGFSIFKFKFLELVRMGTLAANLYFSLMERLSKHEGILPNSAFEYNEPETVIYDMMIECYTDLLACVEYKYISITEYPEFTEYYNETKDAKFNAVID
jgi:hypothetical protein